MEGTGAGITIINSQYLCSIFIIIVYDCFILFRIRIFNITGYLI